jgi:hypothetical protein
MIRKNIAVQHWRSSACRRSPGPLYPTLPCFWCSTEQYDATLHAEHRNNLTSSAVLPQIGHFAGWSDIPHLKRFSIYPPSNPVVRNRTLRGTVNKVLSGQPCQKTSTKSFNQGFDHFSF